MKDNVFLITGAAGGIGMALCEYLLSLGKTVIGTDIDQQRLDMVAQKLNHHKFSVQQLDVCDNEQFKKVCDTVYAQHDTLDCIINNAGIYTTAAFVDVDQSLWKKVISINLMGVVNGCEAALVIMRRQGYGRIINVSSVAGMTPVLNSTPYVATKHAVVGLTNTLREEVGQYGVKVHLVLPGFVDTSIFDHSENRGNLSARKIADATPIKKIPPAQAARYIIDGCLQGKKTVIFPFYAKLVIFLYQLFPELMTRQIVLAQRTKD